MTLQELYDLLYAKRDGAHDIDVRAKFIEAIYFVREIETRYQIPRNKNFPSEFLYRATKDC